MNNEQKSFGQAFSETFSKETNEMKASAGYKLAKLLTSWKGWMWIAAIIMALVMLFSGSTGGATSILAVALVVTLFAWARKFIDFFTD